MIQIIGIRIKVIIWITRISISVQDKQIEGI